MPGRYRGRSPWPKCLRHAQTAARTGKTVAACPYRSGGWATVWLRAYERELQRMLALEE